ncbi:MAG TPA: adenylyl-sulfate kinase [Verrucomicrobiae bacterium]|nr:adenylyl-sulfate kinase [Verrucomicrobiae bacterium]
MRVVAKKNLKSANVHLHKMQIPLLEREQRNGHRGCVVWLTGLSASGKSTIAAELERQLFQLGCQTFVLDGDSMRHGLCSDLGFSHHDRSENIRRVGEVAKLFADAGFICIAAFISPYRADRDMVREMQPKGKFVEIFVNAPLKVCEQRDPKGLYAKAREHKIKNFTGISSAYEPPLYPEIEVRTDKLNLPDTIKKILRHLQKTCDIGEGKKRRAAASAKIHWQDWTILQK